MALNKGQLKSNIWGISLANNNKEGKLVKMLGDLSGPSFQEDFFLLWSYLRHPFGRPVMSNLTVQV